MNHDKSNANVVKFRPKRKHGPVTAEEFMRKLEEDPDYIARSAEFDRQWRARAEENIRAAVPVEDDLRKAGVKISSVNDLIYYRLEEVPAAMPVLLRWLPRVENIAVKECIVRALTDKAAKPLVAPAFIEEFRKAPVTDDARILNLKSAIANGLSVVADESVFNEIAELALDRRHGWSRAMLCTALQRMKNPRVVEVLLQVLHGERGESAAAVTRFAVRALGNKKDPRARPHIEPFVDHPEPVVRKEAEKSLEKIARAEQKVRQQGAGRGGTSRTA